MNTSSDIVKTVINLYEDAVYKNDNIIHEFEIDTIISQIKEFVECDNLVKENKVIENYKNRIVFVNGRRGSGKTTLLKSVMEAIKDDDIGKDIAILDFFDPTLIENKASILLTIIMLIKKEVDDYYICSADENICDRKCFYELSFFIK